MTKQLMTYLCMGTLAMGGAFAQDDDAKDDVKLADKADSKKDVKPNLNLIVDKDGNIFKVVSFDVDGKYAYVMKLIRMDVDTLKAKIKDPMPDDFK